MDVKKFRLAGGLTVKQVVGALRRTYPGYSKITQSMVERPQRYGVRLVPEAEDILTASFPAARKADRHRNRHRLSCRLSETRYEEVKQALEADGRFSSTQAWLEWWVSVWLRKKKTAPGAANTKGGNKGNITTETIAQEGENVNAC